MIFEEIFDPQPKYINMGINELVLTYDIIFDQIDDVWWWFEGVELPIYDLDCVLAYRSYLKASWDAP